MGPRAGDPGHTWEDRRQSEARPCCDTCRRGLGLVGGRAHPSLATYCLSD